MPVLVWDKIGERSYETGLDKGVLYLPDGSAVPWNGLTSIIEHFDKETSPVYYDGMKINDLVVLGDFKASMKAVTYPDEFSQVEGFVSVKSGLYFGDQRPQTFGLCYRTQIGNDLDGEVAGYKIHIIYNLTAIPSDKTYASVTSDPAVVEFEWTISAVPEEVPGLRPTAHLVIDSRKIDPWLLEDIETILYGNIATDASLIPMSTLVSYINSWARVKIVDNGDGTWTATSLRDGFIFVDPATKFFTMININAAYIDDVTYLLSDTIDISDIPELKITDNGDGTWTASTDQDNLIVMVTDDKFEIRNANAEILTPTSYRITDTIAS